MIISHHDGPAVTEPGRAPIVELRLPVDAAEAPLGYPDGDGTLAVEIALAGGGYASLLVPTKAARSWAGALFDAAAVAHREATGDVHALSDLEMAFLPDAGAYDPGPGLVVIEDEAGPARVRLHVAIDVEGRHLDCASLRAALVEASHRPLQHHPGGRLARHPPGRPGLLSPLPFAAASCHPLSTNDPTPTTRPLPTTPSTHPLPTQSNPPPPSTT